MTEPRFSDPQKQVFLRDMARGRPGAASERVGVRLMWWPTINSERVTDARAPYDNQTAAKNAARDFRAQCREFLGEAE